MPVRKLHNLSKYVFQAHFEVKINVSFVRVIVLNGLFLGYG
ncbi:MAG: hypothetical protein ACI9GZ_003236, partial [Bacteroidia bacterium]